MAAAAFTGVLKFKCQDGYVFQHPVTISDVAAEFYVFPDGLGDVTLPSNHGTIALVDVILVTGGTDTAHAQVFCNGRDTGIKISNKANLTTTIQRQFAGAPVLFAPSARLKFKQAA